MYRNPKRQSVRVASVAKPRPQYGLPIQMPNVAVRTADWTSSRPQPPPGPVRAPRSRRPSSWPSPVPRRGTPEAGDRLRKTNRPDAAKHLRIAEQLVHRLGVGSLISAQPDELSLEWRGGLLVHRRSIAGWPPPVRRRVPWCARRPERRGRFPSGSGRGMPMAMAQRGSSPAPTMRERRT